MNKEGMIIFRVNDILRKRMDKLLASEGYSPLSEFVRYAVRKEVERIEGEKNQKAT